MKQTNLDIQALAKKLFHHKQGVQRPKLMHPKRDWLIGVLIGLSVIVMMIGWSAYTYLEKRDAIGMDEPAVQVDVPLYQADAVADALEIFAKRAETFNQLNQSTTPVIVLPEEPVDLITTATTSTSTDQTVAVPEVVDETQVQEAAPVATSTESTPDITDTPTLVD